MDLQDERRSDYQFVEITEKIIGCAFEVIKELGNEFLESVYVKALLCPHRALVRLTVRMD